MVYGASYLKGTRFFESGGAQRGQYLLAVSKLLKMGYILSVCRLLCFTSIVPDASTTCWLTDIQMKDRPG